MMRRLSSQFGSRKKDKDPAYSTVTNANGIQAPSIPEEARPNGAKRNSTFGALNRKKTEPTTNGETKPSAKSTEHDGDGTSRHDVDSMFSESAGLIHASRHPLPTQTGDATYLEEEPAHSSLWQDLRSLGMKDANTLREVALNKASGAPQDDRTYIMERVI